MSSHPENPIEGQPPAGHQDPDSIQSRRHFLKLSSLAAAGLLLGSNLSWPRIARAGDVQGNVLVIGAGIAGLAAAAKLSKIGLNVTVLEGRDRIGGRICSDRSHERIAVDLGDSMIQGGEANPILPLMQAGHVRTTSIPDDSCFLADADGDAVLKPKYDDLQERFNHLLGQVKNQSENEEVDISFADAVAKLNPQRKNDMLMRWELARQVELPTYGTIAALSAAHWNDVQKIPGKSQLLTEGMDTLINQLAADQKIKLRQIVKSIEWDDIGVTVHTPKDVHRADFCICTLPLGVLKTGGVQFKPPLPENKTDAIQRLQMGNVNKVIMFFDKAFWPTEVLHLGYSSSDRGRFPLFLNHRAFSDNNILVGYSVGEYALAMEGHSDEHVEAEAMDVLRTMFPVKAVSPVKTIVTRWGTDRFSHGAGTFMPVGATHADFEAMIEPLGNKLFFAGEHTSLEFHGTVHGAYLSGIREADRIIALAKAATPNPEP